MGRSLEEIASEHRLLPESLIALESDDLKALPGATYVRAYIKSLAAEYSLDTDELLELYRKQSGITESSHSGDKLSFDTGGSSLLSSKKRQYKSFVILFIALSLIVLLIKLFLPSQDATILIDSKSMAPLGLAKSDSLLNEETKFKKDSVDKIIDTDTTINAFIDSINKAPFDSTKLKAVNKNNTPKFTHVSLRMKKDSTWFLIKSNDQKDLARWIRVNQGRLTENRRDTILIEFGSVRNIELKLNSKKVVLKRNQIRIYNGLILGD